MRKRDPAEEFRKGRALHLGTYIPQVLKRLGLVNPKARSKLEAAWIETVGDAAAAHSRVMGVRKNVIDVLVDSSVWKQELGVFRRLDIVEKLQTLDTGEFIRDIKVELGGASAFGE